MLKGRSRSRLWRNEARLGDLERLLSADWGEEEQTEAPERLDPSSEERRAPPPFGEGLDLALSQPAADCCC